MSRRFKLLELRRRRNVPYAGKYKAMDLTMLNQLEFLRRKEGLRISNKGPRMQIDHDNYCDKTRIMFVFESYRGMAPTEQKR